MKISINSTCKDSSIVELAEPSYFTTMNSRLPYSLDFVATNYIIMRFTIAGSFEMDNLVYSVCS